MSKETFAEWLHNVESYYVNSDMLDQKEDEHNVKIKLPTGITVIPNEDGSRDIPLRGFPLRCVGKPLQERGLLRRNEEDHTHRDIRHGEWFTDE